MRIRFCIVISLTLLTSFGCGGSAEVDRKLALEALDQARGLHADILAPKDFQQAREVWDRAQAAEKEGKTDAAKVLYATAKIDFGKAADIAKAKKETLSRQLGTMQAMISENFDQVTIDLASKNLSSTQRGQVKAITVEVEKGIASISKLVTQEDLLKAVSTAKEVQTQIYHAQLILAGQKIR
jgi:hypothetical protein